MIKRNYKTTIQVRIDLDQEIACQNRRQRGYSEARTWGLQLVRDKLEEVFEGLPIEVVETLHVESYEVINNDDEESLLMNQ